MGAAKQEIHFLRAGLVLQANSLEREVLTKYSPVNMERS